MHELVTIETGHIDARFKHEVPTVLLKINKFVKPVHLFGFTVGIYYDARTYKRQ